MNSRMLAVLGILGGAVLLPPLELVAQENAVESPTTVIGPRNPWLADGARAIEIETRTGAICENMEGAAVALACRQLSVPLLEIRGISNRVEDRDTSRWDLTTAMAAVQEAVISLLEKWPGR